MSVLFTILSVVLVLALIYLLLVCPRMVGKPDRTPFMDVHYAHRGLFDNETPHRRIHWRLFGKPLLPAMELSLMCS